MPDAFFIGMALALTAVAFFALALAVWRTGQIAWREHRRKKRRPGYLLDRARLGIDPTRRRSGS